MKHWYSAYDFSLETLPISPGLLSNVLRRSHGDFGRIADYMSSILYNTPNVRAGKFWFTLVNVSCSHTGFSYGILPTPNSAMLPLNSVWDFTFALNTVGYDETYVAQSILSPALNVKTWGSQRGRFLTIGLTPVQSNDFGLRYDMFSVQTLYYVLGALTKSFVLNTKHHTTDDHYKVLERSNFASQYSLWYMRPILNVLKSTAPPFHVYNRFVWSDYSQLLCERHITEQTLMYACLYMRRTKTLPQAVEERCLQLLHTSATNFIQALDSNEALDELGDLLYPAFALRKTLPASGYEQHILTNLSNIKSPSSDLESHLRKLLYA